MTFSNVPVAIDDLPDFAEIQYLELEPGYARLVLAVTLVVEAFIFVAAMTVWFLAVGLEAGAAGVTNGMVIAVALFAVMVLIAAYTFKSARVIGYAVREHDLMRRSGIFFHKEVVQPLRRVQHVEVNRGPLEKRLGLASISLFSAGSGKATFTIPGLKLITAVRLRRYVLQSERRSS